MSASTAEGWLAEDSLPELVNLLCTVETKWYHLGVQLRIPSSTLLRIQEDYQMTQDRFTRMLQEWLRTQKPTKNNLVAALRSEVLQENRLADQVERWIPLSSPRQGQHGTSASNQRPVGQQGASVSHCRLRGPANGILPKVRQAVCRHSRKTAMTGLAILLIWSVLRPMINPYHYLAMEPDQPTESPSNVHLSPPDLPTLQPIMELSTLTSCLSSEPLIGREKDKQVILNWLEFQTSTVQIVSIVGGPGVGKSALACDVGHTMAQQETEVHYVDMYNSSNRVQPFISKPLEDWTEKIRHPTLLILDNCDHYLHRQKEEFQNLLDSLKRFYIKLLITSQVGNTLAFPGHSFEEYHLQKLEKDQAMSLLHRNVEGLNSSTADYICDLVDNNPLALITIAAHLNLIKRRCNLQCMIEKLEKDPIGLFRNFTNLPSKYSSVVSSIKLAYDYLDPKYQKCGWQLAKITGPFDETALAAHMKPYDPAQCLDIFTKYSLLEYSELTFVKQGAKFCVSHQVYLEVMCEHSDSMTTIYKLPRLVRHYILRVSKNLPEQLLSTAPAHVPIETQFKYIWMPKCAPNWPQHKVVPSSYADEMLPVIPRHAGQTLHAVVEVGVKAFHWGILNNFTKLT